jgi:acetoacetyl-CoA synthetase
MPLFVKTAPGIELDAALRGELVARLRSECSPRHVPDEIHRVPDVPYTLTAKKMEVPVRRILGGAAPDRVAMRDAMRNPESIDWFVTFARTLAGRQLQRDA